jgi:hypothetical protein
MRKAIHVIIFLNTISLWGENLWIQKSGDLNGILISKGEAWVEVKEDSLSVERYLAPWVGQSPSRGGGFEPKLLANIQDLVVGNRVKMTWFWDGHLRVGEIKHLKPKKKSGIFNGILIQKGDKWIDVENEGSDERWRFYAQWVGGLPEDGGSYNPKTLEYFNNFNELDSVRFVWSYDHRPRIERFVEQPKDNFIPFYEGKPVPGSPLLDQPADDITSPLDQVKPISNPFDQVTPVNPFDQIPATNPNPFDSLTPTNDNPFDSINKSVPENKVNPSVNPFDSLPQEKTEDTGNPFDDVPLPGNPFDSVKK